MLAPQRVGLQARRGRCLMAPMDRPLVIWVVGDGKAGHEAQSMGLAQAIARVARAEIHRVVVEPRATRGLGRFRTAAPRVEGVASPAVAIGAGAATHSTLLACGRERGARTVVLMNPGWRRRAFDLCVIPRHDGVREGGNVVVTTGAINLVRPSSGKDESRGFVLLGGPSRHHGWDSAGVARQVRAVVERGGAGVAWTLTTSRRTPPDAVDAVERAFADAPALRSRLEVFPVERTDRDWLLGMYERCAQVWVSEDSVSMVYEAITSGACVGLLRVARTGAGGRVTRGLDDAARAGWATWFEEWSAGGVLPEPRGALDEASRVAGIVMERFGLAVGGGRG